MPSAKGRAAIAALDLRLFLVRRVLRFEEDEFGDTDWEIQLEIKSRLAALVGFEQGADAAEAGLAVFAFDGNGGGVVSGHNGSPFFRAMT